MSRKSKSILALAVLATATAYAGTKTSFKSTWKSPNAQPVHFKGQKVVALVMNPDVAVRRGAEDELARQIKLHGAVGVPAYTLVKEEDIKDKEAAKAAFEKAGILGVVSMRVVSKDKELTAAGGTNWILPAYGAFWGTDGSEGYYGYGWGGVYSPSYISTNNVVGVETLVYSLRQNELVWAGQSETTNASDVNKLISQLIQGTIKEMKEAGLMSPQAK
jgi:hypothetical protein